MTQATKTQQEHEDRASAIMRDAVWDEIAKEAAGRVALPRNMARSEVLEIARLHLWGYTVARLSKGERVVVVAVPERNRARDQVMRSVQAYALAAEGHLISGATTAARGKLTGASVGYWVEAQVRAALAQDRKTVAGTGMAPVLVAAREVTGEAEASELMRWVARGYLGDASPRPLAPGVRPRVTVRAFLERAAVALNVWDEKTHPDPATFPPAGATVARYILAARPVKPLRG